MGESAPPSDVFSLGVILFELCTGKRLFRGQNEMDTLKMIVEGEYHNDTAHQGYLEPISAVATVDAGGRLNIWAQTQGIFTARQAKIGRASCRERE